MAPHTVVLALGSNLGDRLVHLRTAIDGLRGLVRIARLSSVWETAPVDAPPGSESFLNMVVAGWTSLTAVELLEGMHRVEAAMGRVRRQRNEPRVIDLDLIFFGASVSRGAVVLPHPRYRQRAFVMEPLRELGLPWIDPATSVSLARWRGEGDVLRLQGVYDRMRGGRDARTTRE